MLAGIEIAKAFAPGGAWTAVRDGEQINSKYLQIGPNSLDLTLSPVLLATGPRNAFEAIDLFNPASVVSTDTSISESGLVLQPGVLYIGASRERFKTDAPIGGKHYVQVLHGRSTLARAGLEVHQAGLADFGFSGVWVFEIQVVYPTRIYPNVRIAQVCFETLEGMPERYMGQYANQSGPRAAELGEHRF